jgi:hypothetical protein
MKTPFSCINSFEKIDRKKDLSKDAEEIFKEKYLSAKFYIDKKYLDDLKRILLTNIDFNPIFERETSDKFIFQLKYVPSEEGYLLQKFRYLGQRAIIIEPRSLVEKMYITYKKAIDRYF